VKVRFALLAERELKDAVEYYESAQEGLGADFLAEAEAAVRLIETHLLAWTPMSSRTRRCRMHRSPFGLF
jgi:hypothetical protein